MASPQKIQDVETPAFLVDIDTVKGNVERMQQRSEKLGVKLRPHMKTHKTIELGEMMTQGSKRRIAVSTVTEAEFFADAGFEDILYAYVFSADKLARLKKLANNLESFHLFVDNEHALRLLENNPVPANKKWSAFLDVDVGYLREGVQWDTDLCVELAKRIHVSQEVTLKGLYTHEGHAYAAVGRDAIHHVGNEVAQRLVDVTTRLKAEGIDGLEVTMGSTPSMSQPGQDVRLVTEIHPGNYVFYDAMQTLLGSCTESDVAGRVATRVLAHYPLRNQMIVDAGFLALSHDKGRIPQLSIPHGGICVVQGHPELRFCSMAQEVGVIEPLDGILDFSAFPIGSLLFLLPYHSCATAAMYGQYYLHSADDIKGVIKPCRGW